MAPQVHHIDDLQTPTNPIKPQNPKPLELDPPNPNPSPLQLHLQNPNSPQLNSRNPKPLQRNDANRACFSYAAYAKTVINHLSSCSIPIAPGLTNQEFKTLETSLSISFPPDLRIILEAGVPVGHGFPNWRQLGTQGLVSARAHLSTGLAHWLTNHWPSSFGSKPSEPSLVKTKADALIRESVPIYGDFYIPSSPDLGSNPVLWVRANGVKWAGFDLVDFFERIWGVAAPAWRAKRAREIEFWKEIVEMDGGDAEGVDGVDCGEGMAEIGNGMDGGDWGEGVGGEGVGGKEWVEKVLGEAGWRLREGGWKEEEVREMVWGNER
ncbi:uncharacterized protein LOC18442486 [Amborella trichopoda]|uniref:Knr4/Smi1-like domain-containing protein n=1 Tax=Amborella trichopoda TaxID=13333 RepID=U5CM77_AMBTC|nr:uncharacterized protein LOC18442486 [Amborella trichopoda]ERN14231.1 hypothetical protein AMTR_s00033p00135640 [Amborella trichopoda]|eukprot:XP_006852764.1 uncharacterized protein LOC18442486 [Amborella trichopoda]